MDRNEAMAATDPLLRDLAAAVQAGLAGTGISMGMRAVLEAVYRNGPMSAGEMGERLGLEPAFVHRMAGSAEAAGLLEPMPDPAHREAHFFQITREGRMAVHRIRDGETRYLRRIAREEQNPDPGAQARIHKALELFFAGGDAAPQGEAEH